jgi:DNA primase
LGRKFPPAQLLAGGLVKPRQQGEGHYDTFRNRLMFPIRDESGRVIAFGGRKMPGSEDPAKYLNSPETPLFSKGRCIFGIDLARQKMVETRTAVVVEGYTDVIVAHQFGVGNVVSPLGTALTEQHVGVLRRFADRIVLLFDADTAGDAAVDRAVGLFLTQPVEVLIASMPPAIDPDEYLLAHGAEGFQAILDGAADALSYKWKQLARQFEGSDGNLTGQQRAVEAYLEVLGAARGSGPVDAIRWGSALARVSRLTDIPADELNRRFRRRLPRTSVAPTAAAEQPKAPQPPKALNAQDRAERWILGALLLEGRRWHEVQAVVRLEDFADERCRKLAEIYWTHQRDEGEPVFNEFLGVLQEHDPDLIELAIEATEEVEALADPGHPLAEAIAHLEQARRLREERKLVAALRRTTDQRPERDEIDLLKELQERARQPNLKRV